MIIHHVGNKGREEGCLFSETSILPSETIESLLLEHYLLPLSELDEVYEFNHDPRSDVDSNADSNTGSDLDESESPIDSIPEIGEQMPANIIAELSSKVFEFEDFTQEISVKIAEHLYSVTSHPNISGGDFIIILFSNIFVNADVISALGIFKVESKDDYLDIFDNNGTLEFVEKEGISLKDIQKGALILSHDASVLAIDSNKKRTKYWHEDFLNLQPKQTELAELRASNALLRGLSKRIEAPDQRLEFNRHLEAHLNEHDEIRFRDLENFSRNYVEEQDINRVFKSVQNKSGFEIDKNRAVPSDQFREESQNYMKKMRISNGIDLVISNQDAYLNGITIEETEKGFRAVIDFDIYGSVEEEQ